MVAVGSIILIALAYAGMHLYKKDNPTNDTKDRSADNFSSGDNHHHSGFTTFFNEISNIVKKKDKEGTANFSVKLYIGREGRETEREKEVYDRGLSCTRITGLGRRLIPAFLSC